MKTSHPIRYKQFATGKWEAILSMVGCMLFAAGIHGQTKQAAHPSDPLHQLNDSVEALVQRVSPTIVQIQVSGYASSEDVGQGQASVIVGRQKTIGSGVIVDPDGYIVTNAHVVKGAQKIEVIVPPATVSDKSSDNAQNGRERIFDARVVGIANQLDLAVIKIEAHTLPALSIRGTVQARQGEMVFAFGSPEGLRNSVTMGVVSAVARQPDPDSPLVYVQTDTPINPGNSGGPLVNADGDLVGINTFILSSSGGNQGLGFAIPAGVLAYAYPQLVKYGHIHQPEIGAILQSITPELSAGLHLARDFGVIVSDVTPGGPAEQAGLKVQDIIVRVDDMRTENLPLFGQSLYMHGSGDHVKLEVLRGSTRMDLDVSLGERPHKVDSLVDSVDPAKNLVPRLGIIGVELNVNLAHSLPELRIPSGVIVAAKTLGAGSGEVPLQTGDVIHGLNGTTVTGLSDLKDGLAKLAPGDSVVLWIERYGQLIYVSFVI
ncbi:MAG TPA: trypsin-like peptidase domain-containing protein [Candidatus Acidoferrales bacterium]|jgi:serine protease Do|nr:trypsin-like peptidase domain-containing protein [Candidatus Acidoferrales bacterium]